MHHIATFVQCSQSRPLFTNSGGVFFFFFFSVSYRGNFLLNGNQEVLSAEDEHVFDDLGDCSSPPALLVDTVPVRP
jgi:hypothetical protein